MSISIYKPNSKNTGSGFSFQIGISKKSRTSFIRKINITIKLGSR